jgi:thiamine-monophosphate kinase
VEQDAVVCALLRAHHEPQPRLDDGRAIARTVLATAMMDLSDGLAEDLPRLCAESGVGARIRSQDIPVHPQAEEVAARLGTDALRLATSGGEDYELLFTCPPSAVPELTAAVQDAAGTQTSVIGDITHQRRLVLLDGVGDEGAFGAGFDHFRATGNEA